MENLTGKATRVSLGERLKTMNLAAAYRARPRVVAIHSYVPTCSDSDHSDFKV
jgi:hypothetical protein